MTLRWSKPGGRVSLFAVLVFVSVPLEVAAQDVRPIATPATALELAQAASPIVLPSTPDAALAGSSLSQAERPAVEPARTIGTTDRLLFASYAAFVTLQALEIHSTRSALARGGVEGNPVMAGVVGSPAAFVAVKAAASAGIVFAAEKLRRRNRVAAIVLMAGLNSAYAMVVTHNYRVAR